MILCCKKKWLLALCLALGMPLTAVSIHAQTVTQAEQVVNGVVTDSNGEPIIGASVRVGKSDNGAVTAFGHFDDLVHRIRHPERCRHRQTALADCALGRPAQPE